jgi:3'-phosphoadenosine 5'-phosphosulfate sulfotransferase (PAPS reductase)/FAD synthetase
VTSIATAVARVAAAREKYNPIAVVGLLSGGHDSLAANIVAHEAGADFSLHINTGIGVPATRQFVIDTCEREGWKLREYKATENLNAKGESDPQIYEVMVRKHGFPGPFMHRKMYNRLKERQLRQFEREMGATSDRPVLYISGMRSDESTRRMGNMKRDSEMGIVQQGRRAWLAPIHDFSKGDCLSCIQVCGVRKSPVVEKIGKSGECLCGAFAKKGELAILAVSFPHVAKRIMDLQAQVASAFPWGWEDEGPPVWWRESRAGQDFMQFWLERCSDGPATGAALPSV